tara:strand:- start:157 stop:396 length:240 start_codon:yes stop_codon:yes gene_type:complete
MINIDLNLPQTPSPDLITKKRAKKFSKKKDTTWIIVTILGFSSETYTASWNPLDEIRKMIIEAAGIKGKKGRSLKPDSK